VVVGDVTRYAIPKQEPLQIELSAFRDAVLGEGEDVVGIRDAARTVAVAEAMMRGAESSERESPA
jgi:UDP-N-acetylglucosamine 3-dehydrogenase